MTRRGWFAILLMLVIGAGLTWDRGSSEAEGGEVLDGSGTPTAVEICAYLRVVPKDGWVDPGIVVPWHRPGRVPWAGPKPGDEVPRRSLRGHQPPPSTCHPIPPAVFVSPERHQS